VKISSIRHFWASIQGTVYSLAPWLHQ